MNGSAEERTVPSRRRMLTGAATGLLVGGGALAAVSAGRSQAVAGTTDAATSSGDPYGVFNVLDAYGTATSGADPTGANDSWKAIQQAIDAASAGQGGIVYFPPGQYSISEPLTIDYSGVELVGAGYGFISEIICNFTSEQTGTPGMIICGTSTAGPLSYMNISGLCIQGNMNQYSGHGIVWRVEVGKISDCIIQFVALDGVHCSYGDLSVGNSNFKSEYNDSLVMENVYVEFPGVYGNASADPPTGCGLFTDEYLTSSEFYACHFDGGALAGPGSAAIGKDFPNGGITTPFSTYGMYIQGGNLKFVDCHPFTFLSGGMYCNGARGIQIIGGEYESNNQAGITFYDSTRCSVLQASFYDSPNPTTPPRHILANGGSTFIEIGSCEFHNGGVSVPGAGIEIAVASSLNIHHNKFTDTGLAHAVLCDAGDTISYVTITENLIDIAGGYSSAIAMGSATNCYVAGNRIMSQSSINEYANGDADYNVYIGNDVTAFGGGGIKTVGANSEVIANLGNNPVGYLATQPTVPTSGNPYLNSYGYACDVYISGGAVTAVEVGDVATGVTSGMVRVAVGQEIILTYTKTPTWQWFGE
jgi:hypothetical protein